MPPAKPGAPGKTAYYSRPWATAVYLDWDEGYARATEHVLKYTGKTREDCISWIQHGDRRWEIMKATRKMLVRICHGRLQHEQDGSILFDHLTYVEWLRSNAVVFWEARCMAEVLDP
jgi:hypothetical protein